MVEIIWDIVKRKLFKHTERSTYLLKGHMKNILRLVMVCSYKVLIKAGCSDIYRKTVG